MRLILTLIIASAVGSILVGGFRSHIGPRTPRNPYFAIFSLYQKDRQGTAKMIEKAVLNCYPDLEKVKSNNGRKLVSQIFISAFEFKREHPTGKLSRDEMQQRTLKIVAPVFETLSYEDQMILTGVIKKMKGEVADSRCIAKTVLVLTQSTATGRPKQLFSDVQLRGS